MGGGGEGRRLMREEGNWGERPRGEIVRGGLFRGADLCTCPSSATDEEERRMKKRSLRRRDRGDREDDEYEKEGGGLSKGNFGVN